MCFGKQPIANECQQGTVGKNNNFPKIKLKNEIVFDMDIKK